MTGSLSKSTAVPPDAAVAQSKRALSPQIQHALSPQWNELVLAADRFSALKTEGESWWKTQADRLAKQWLTSGLPTPRLEEWKYTNLKEIHSKVRTVTLGSLEVTAPAEVQFLRLSQVREQKLSDELRTKVQSILDSTQAPSQTGGVFFEDFAKSLTADPYLVLVPPDFSSDTPIEMKWVSGHVGEWTVGVAAIVVGKNSKVSLIEKYGNEVDAQAISTSVEVGSNATLSHLRLQAGTGDGFVFASTRAKVLADARYETTQVSFGSQLSREDLVVELCERGAEAVTDGVFIGRSTQLLDHHTNLIHRVGNTTSGQIYKGVLADESRGVFNGRIAISKNASGSNSSQMNKNLLLSRKVELDTKPQLEIDNDDVKAAHGAAIGRLDAEHIFYLRSRGIGMAQAVEMLARGFAMEAVERLSSAKLRSLGTSEIERGLAGLSWEAL